MFQITRLSKMTVIQLLMFAGIALVAAMGVAFKDVAAFVTLGAVLLIAIAFALFSWLNDVKDVAMAAEQASKDLYDPNEKPDK